MFKLEFLAAQARRRWAVLNFEFLAAKAFAPLGGASSKLISLPRKRGAAARRLSTNFSPQKRGAAARR